MRSRAPKPIEPGVYPVILEPQAVADLLGFLTSSFDARNADEGRSAYAGKDGKTKVGEALFSERLNLFSDPMHADMPAAPVTAEGVPAARLSLIKAGVLENLEYSRFWAQERQRQPTPGPVNYILESTTPPVGLDEMIKGMKRGLVISRFWYVRLIDPRSLMLTGLTRDGLWWVENGQVRYPVRNLRFNQSVLAMLAPWNVEAIGALAAAVAVHGAGAAAVVVRLHVGLRRDLATRPVVRRQGGAAPRRVSTAPDGARERSRTGAEPLRHDASPHPRTYVNLRAGVSRPRLRDLPGPAETSRPSRHCRGASSSAGVAARETRLPVSMSRTIRSTRPEVRREDPPASPSR